MLLANTLQGTVGQFAVGVFTVTSIVLAKQITTAPGDEYRATYAFMETAIGLGNLIGGFALGLVTTRVRKGRLIIAAYVAFGALVFLVGNVSSVLVVLGLLFGVGVANMAFIIPSQTLFQERTPPELMGRVVSFRFAIVFGGMSIAMAVGGLLTTAFGPGPVIAAAGLISMAAGSRRACSSSSCARRDAAIGQPWGGGRYTGGRARPRRRGDAREEETDHLDDRSGARPGGRAGRGRRDGGRARARGPATPEPAEPEARPTRATPSPTPRPRPPNMQPRPTRPTTRPMTKATRPTSRGRADDEDEDEDDERRRSGRSGRRGSCRRRGPDRARREEPPDRPRARRSRRRCPSRPSTSTTAPRPCS